jgi:hypothetical protein
LLTLTFDSAPKVTTKRRGFTEEDKQDLEVCLERCGNDEDLAFGWDTTLYVAAKQAGNQLPNAPGAVTDFQRLVVDKGFAVNTLCLCQAPEGDAEIIYVGKIKEHWPDTGELWLQWYHCANTDVPIAERVYQLSAGTKQQSGDLVEMSSLQEPNITLTGKERSKRKFTAGSLKSFMYWVDALRKVKDRQNLDRMGEGNDDYDDLADDLENDGGGVGGM